MEGYYCRDYKSTCTNSITPVPLPPQLPLKQSHAGCRDTGCVLILPQEMSKPTLGFVHVFDVTQYSGIEWAQVCNGFYCSFDVKALIGTNSLWNFSLLKLDAHTNNMERKTKCMNLFLGWEQISEEFKNSVNKFFLPNLKPSQTIHVCRVFLQLNCFRANVTHKLLMTNRTL